MEYLEYVKSREEILQSLSNFNTRAKTYPDRTRKLVRQTTYWIYDSVDKTFGPNKFVAYKDMTFQRYENALHEGYQGDRHDGHFARLAVERILEPYECDDRLHISLINWAESISAKGVFNGINEQKWKFTYLR